MEQVKPGYKKTEVGVIPADWDFQILDKHSKRGSGHTPNKKNKEYYDGTIVWVSLADSDRLDKGLIETSSITISAKGIANSSAVLHPKGVVLISRDAGIGKSAVAGCPLCVSQHFITWQCNESTLHNWYLYYWLQANKSEFERIAIGSTIKTIGLPYFKKYRIVLPSYTEQKAIANALSDADALIANLEKLIAKKKAIKQGAMQQLLTPPHKGGKRLEGFSGEWKEVFFKDIMMLQKKTTHQSSHSINEGLYPFFTNSTTDIIEKYLNEFDFDTEAIIANTGGAAYFKYYNGKFANMADCLIITTSINTRFLYFVLKTNEAIVNNRYFTGSGIKHLDKSHFLNFRVFIPEILEQAAITAVLNELTAVVDSLESKMKKYLRIKQGMMQELLTGKTRLI